MVAVLVGFPVAPGNDYRHENTLRAGAAEHEGLPGWN